MKYVKNILVLGLALASAQAFADLPAPPGSPESQCGTTLDFQHVEQYDGTLGPSIGFVADHQGPVGQIQWNSNLATIYAQPGNVSGVRWCTGTLIAKNLFLTAGHCFDPEPNDGVGWDFPIDNATGSEITAQQAALNMHINFNYQLDTGGSPQTEVEVAVTSLVEYRLGGHDYAILSLAGTPGNQFGVANVTPRHPGVGDMLTIIQHPSGWEKQVEAGEYSFDSSGYMHYANLDTLGGSSGSGVLHEFGELIGVHTHGGCYTSGGTNKGVPIHTLVDFSATLENLAYVDPAKTYRLQNHWNFNAFISVDSGGTVGSSHGNWSSNNALWEFEKIGAYYRIKNVGMANEYLHVENGYIESGNAPSGWHSSHWQLEFYEDLPVASWATGRVFKIKNRWTGDYLHVENGSLEVSSVHPLWWSSRWFIEAQ